MLKLFWFVASVAMGLRWAYCAGKMGERILYRMLIGFAFLAFLVALKISASATVIPANAWLLTTLPGQGSAIQEVIAVIFTVIGCMAFVVGIPLVMSGLVRVESSSKPMSNFKRLYFKMRLDNSVVLYDEWSMKGRAPSQEQAQKILDGFKNGKYCLHPISEDGVLDRLETLAAGGTGNPAHFGHAD